MHDNRGLLGGPPLDSRALLDTSGAVRVLARTQTSEFGFQFQINNLPGPGRPWELACSHPRGVELMSLRWRVLARRPVPCFPCGGPSGPAGGAVGAGPLWPADGQGGHLHGGALSSISAIGGGGGGVRGETEGAGPRGPPSCAAEPSGGRSRD